MPADDALTDLGREMLGEIPPRFFEDPDFRAVIHVFARESERARALGTRVRDNLIAARIDELGLPWWERLYRFDAGVSTEATRVARVLSRTQQTAPRVSSGEFSNDMDELVGVGAWTYEEEWPAIRVKLPYVPGSDPFLRAEREIRELQTFPAHLDLILENVEGFILDQSQLDQEPFHDA